MATLEFTKMHGCGNDYVYVVAMRARPADPAALSVKLSDRHFGVGGDGLIMLAPSHKADIRMEMYNADGSRGDMCGNGIRCLARLAFERGLVRANPMVVETDAGLKIGRAAAARPYRRERDGRYGRADSRRPRNPGEGRRPNHRLPARGRRPARVDHGGLDGQSALRAVRRRRRRVQAPGSRFCRAGPRVRASPVFSAPREHRIHPGRPRAAI